MTRTTFDQLGTVRKVSAEATRRMSSRPASQPSVSSVPAEASEGAEHGPVGSALRLGAMLLMLPLGLALATGGAWPSVLWLGAALVAAGLWTAYEDVSERRKVEMGVELAEVNLAKVELSGVPGGETGPKLHQPDNRSLN